MKTGLQSISTMLLMQPIKMSLIYKSKFAFLLKGFCPHEYYFTNSSNETVGVDFYNYFSLKNLDPYMTNKMPFGSL